MMKSRDLYLNQLREFKDKPLIKVITGIRRCGKSSLLSLYKEDLIKSGAKADQVIFINFEAMEFDELKTYKELYAFIKAKKRSTPF